MNDSVLEKPISNISGVGKVREQQLNKLGLYTYRDLVYFFPRAYENRGNILNLANAPANINCSLLLTVASVVRTTTTRNGLTISKFKAYDNSDGIDVVFFNSAFVKDIFHIGTTFRFWGKIICNKSTRQLVSPSYEPYLLGEELPNFVPIYPLTEGLSSKYIDKIVKTAISESLPEIVDFLPESIRLKNHLPTITYALKNVHFPNSEEELKSALSRLAFDEMLTFGIGIAFMSKFKKELPGIKFNPCDLSPLTNMLPYDLTSSQKKAINDIYSDTVLNVKNPMSRIIVGDVGSGKTICAVYAIYIAVKSGYQVALMAPTEILATQHYNDISALLKDVGITTELLIGSTTAKEKNRITAAAKLGKIDLIVGTHALISDKVEFESLGLVITDEQHRFGVDQRAKLKDKSHRAHMLVMSATPIPRTLALTMYGDLDVSRITEMPKGRQRVDTFVVDESYRNRLLDFISKQISNGGQCYVICPAIEDNFELEDAIIPSSINVFSKSDATMKNVVNFTVFLRQNLPNLKIECMHGRIKSSEKDSIMSKFSKGEIDILVSTTVIEVGINVPNASLIVIENAERFGLAQLHQLRGRVGRGDRKSYCVLVSGTANEKSKARLEIMRTTYDGYEIAEKDLVLRGPGDFFASDAKNMRQSGGFEFKLAKLCDDHTLFAKAFESAKSIVESDPELISEENHLLKKEVSKYIIPLTSTIS